MMPIYLNKEDYKAIYGKDYRTAKIYIDILSHALDKSKSSQWKDRIFDKVCRFCRWSGEDLVNFSKSLISGQDAVPLENFLDLHLAEIEQDRYWGGSRDEFEQNMIKLYGENYEETTK